MIYIQRADGKYWSYRRSILETLPTKVHWRQLVQTKKTIAAIIVNYRSSTRCNSGIDGRSWIMCIIFSINLHSRLYSFLFKSPLTLLHPRTRFTCNSYIPIHCAYLIFTMFYVSINIHMKMKLNLLQEAKLSKCICILTIAKNIDSLVKFATICCKSD